MSESFSGTISFAIMLVYLFASDFCIRSFKIHLYVRVPLSFWVPLELHQIYALNRIQMGSARVTTARIDLKFQFQTKSDTFSPYTLNSIIYLANVSIHNCVYIYFA